MSDITLSQRIRQNLLSLKDTATNLTTTQEHLATSKKFNTAFDNPTSHLQSQSLNNRANDLKLKLAFLALLAFTSLACAQPATTAVPGTLLTHPLTLGGTTTISGPTTLSGATTAFKVAGANASITENGQGSIGGRSTNGAAFIGEGSTSDITLLNKSSQAVCNIGTGTQTPSCNPLFPTNPLTTAALSLGTSGAALTGNGASAPTHPSPLQSGTGAVARGLVDKARDIINAKDFGVVCDGSTDTTTALAAAITYAVSVNSELEVPVGVCVVGGSSRDIFTIAGPLQIKGHGWCVSTTNSCAGSAAQGGTIILIKTGTTAANLFHIAAGANKLQGFKFSDFAILFQSSGNTRAFLFDNSTSAGSIIYSVVDHVYMAEPTTAASMQLANPGSNASGGVSLFTLQNSVVLGGIVTSNIGDSIRVFNNQLGGANAACVTVNQVSNAGNFLIIGNNGTCAGGGVDFQKGISGVIAYNEFEQTTAIPSSSGFIINVDGTGVTDSLSIVFNELTEGSASGVSGAAINIASTSTVTNTYIVGNRIGLSSSVPTIQIGSAAVNTAVGVNTKSGGTGVSNSAGTTTSQTGASNLVVADQNPESE